MTITKNFHPVVKYLIPISAKTPLDDLLQKFFIKYLGYAEIRFDDRDPNPHRPEAWRLVYPDTQSLPFMVAYRSGLSGMSRKEVGRLYLDAVKDRLTRAASQRPPALYIFTDGRRFVFFSADPFRNRDDRFDLSESTIAFTGNQEKVENLKRANLIFSAARLGIKRPQVDFLFRTTPLSQDERFKAYVHYIRHELLQAALEDNQALATVVRHLLDPELVDEKGRLKLSAEALYLRFGQGLSDALAGAVDTLLLRLILIRFVEAYYGQTSGLRIIRQLLYDANVQRTYIQMGEGLFQNPIDDLSEAQRRLAQFVDKAIHPDASRRKYKKNLEARQLDLFIPASPKAIKELAAEEEQRKIKLGGDFFLSDLAEAATALETRFLADLKGRGAIALVDFLGRTAEDSQWEFRYEDLRPQTIQDYYEESLGTAVQVSLNPVSKELELAVTRSRRQQKELGAFYTDPRLCRFMVEKSVKPLLEERLVSLERAIQEKNEPAAEAALNGIVGMRICDPTMGSAPFLRSAFDYLSEQYETIVRKIEPAKEALPRVWARWAADWPFLTENTLPDENGIGRWEWHILRCMLYGVDIDLKAVCIASQTFALSSLRYLPQGERFPSFFSVNLKRGNALINPVLFSERTHLAEKYKDVIVEAIKLRHVAATTTDYNELSKILEKFDQLVQPIINEFVAENVSPYTDEATADLRPFCWELEFPEIFFTKDGGLREDAGFDIIISNPPWNIVEVDDDEFFDAIDYGFSQLPGKAKDARKTALLSNPDIKSLYDDAYSRLNAFLRLINRSGLYQLQGVERTVGFPPKHNYYKLATEVFIHLGHKESYFSIVVPQGITSEEGSKKIRGYWLDHVQLSPILSFTERNPFFSRPQAFSIVSGRYGKPGLSVAHLSGLTEADDLKREQQAIAVPTNLIRDAAPLSYNFQSITSPIELEILDKLYKFPTLDKIDVSWGVSFGTEEINMTRGRKYFSSEPTPYPLAYGDLVSPYKITLPGNIFITPEGFQRACRYPNAFRLVWRDVANQSLARRMSCTIIPPNVLIGNSLNWLVPSPNFINDLYMLALLQSYCLEWRVRQLSTNNHINKFIVKQLPIPRIDNDDPKLIAIATRVAKLICQNDYYQAIANKLQVVGIEDEKERQILMWEIEAMVAIVYDLTEREYIYILSKFSKVEDEIKAGILAEYRRLAQEAAHA